MSPGRRGREHRGCLQEPQVDTGHRPERLQGLVHAHILDGRRYYLRLAIDGCNQTRWASPALFPLRSNQVVRVEQTASYQRL